jgi:hypothetical protein
MQKSFEIIRQPRQFLIAMTENLSLEQLNKVPAGFNNNIIWNIGHLVAAQQSICYLRGGHPVIINDDYFNTYKSGSKPERWITQEEVEETRQLLVSTLSQLEADYANGMFSSYTPWVTRYGVPINTIDDAIAFLPFHEGLHMGYIMALKRVVG